MDETTFILNGTTVSVRVDRPASLLEVLREDLGLTGTKGACSEGECGACTVLLDGEPVCSCLVLAADAEGSSVTTVEGLAEPGSLHPVQQALVDAGGVQCGFCTPGFAVAAAALLAEGVRLDDAELRERLAGNLCRCTGYGGILRALRPLLGRESTG